MGDKEVDMPIPPYESKPFTSAADLGTHSVSEPQVGNPRLFEPIGAATEAD